MLLAQRDIRDQAIKQLLKTSLHQTRLQLSSRQQQISSLRQRMTQRQMLSQQQLIAELEKAAAAGCEKSKEVLARKISSERNLYGSSVVTDGHMISVSVD